MSACCREYVETGEHSIWCGNGPMRAAPISDPSKEGVAPQEPIDPARRARFEAAYADLMATVAKAKAEASRQPAPVTMGSVSPASTQGEIK